MHYRALWAIVLFLWVIVISLWILVLFRSGAYAQGFRDPDYPHSAFIPYGRGGPQYRGDYYGTYRNPIPWYTAPAARSYRAEPYYGGEAWRAQRPESFRYPGRPMLPGCQAFQCNFRGPGGSWGWNW